MAEADAITDLRELLGQSIPDGGSAADTLFTDERIGTWIDSTPSMNAAALKGWTIIMAHWAHLVNVTDGAASREMSDLMEHAETMVARFTRLNEGARIGRTRVGKIVRTP